MSAASGYNLTSIPYKFVEYGYKTPEKGIILNEFGGSVEVTSRFNFSVGDEGRKAYRGQTEVRDEKVHLDVPGLIKSAGFSYDDHFVETRDGYILRIFRLSNPRCGQNKKERRPVFLQHDFAGTAADWLILDKERTLPFILSNNGWDVWLGNSRGNEYSRNHSFLNYRLNTGKFWDFSFHEQGVYDLPAVIDHILKVTKRQNITYIGHGLGTTPAYVLLNEYPCIYNAKIDPLVSLGPQAFISNTESLYLKKMAQLTKNANYLPLDSVLTPSALNQLSRFVVPELCSIHFSANRSLCDAFVFLVSGTNPRRRNETVLTRILGHVPSTTSTKTLLHVLQLVREARFGQFDYGPKENMRRYGRILPPKYNLFNVETTNVNIYGFRDNLLNNEDVQTSVDSFSSNRRRFNVLLFGLGYKDFLWANNPALVLNYLIMSILDEYYAFQYKDDFSCDEPS